jgi:hypothetical protein
MTQTSPILMTFIRRHWRNLLLWSLFLLSVPVKFIAGQQAPFDHDYVPVVAYGWQWLSGMGGATFPAYGTLSSVAAYNMPLLVWLYTPVQLITQDIFAVLLITGLALNGLGMVALWRWFGALFGEDVGLLAGALFIFSEVAISSSYTAWAQVHLPTFFALASYSAWCWWQADNVREASLWLALMGIVAFMAFMMHFAAVMLFVALFIGAIVMRARWTWQGLLGGFLACVVLIAPYATFQQSRDWVDVRAFLSREPFLTDQQLNDAQQLARTPLIVNDVPDNRSDPTPETATNTPPTNMTASIQDDTPPSIAERILNFLLEIPEHIINAFLLPMRFGTTWGTWLVFFTGVALVRVVWWVGHQLWQVRGLFWRIQWRNSAEGNMGVLVLMWLVLVLGFIVTRNAPNQQATYYMGTIAWYVALSAWGISLVAKSMGKLVNRATLAPILMALVALAFIVGNSAERIGRIQTWDNTRTDAPNIWQLRHIEAITEAIAQAYPSADELTIVYDILRYQPQLWWVVAWHEVDNRYRAGMPFDHVLLRNHGIRNNNASAVGGDADVLMQTDAIVTTIAGAQRYTAYTGEKMRFGGLMLILP